jgi:hypothetical protein
MVASEREVHVSARRSRNERSQTADVGPSGAPEATADARANIAQPIESHRGYRPEVSGSHLNVATDFLAMLKRSPIMTPDIEVTARRADRPKSSQPRDNIRNDS